jgi:hypothetical protein
MSKHVQKVRVPVRLSQPNLDPRDGWFLLLPRLESEDRPETIIDLLNSSLTVIPFIVGDDGAVLLVMRANIDWVSVGDGVSPSLIHPAGVRAHHQQRVQLRFIDESRVDAVIEWRDERGGTRLSDFLNFGDPFVAVRTGFGTLLVNKLRIRETRIVSETAAATDKDSQRFRAAS